MKHRIVTAWLIALAFWIALAVSANPAWAQSSCITSTSSTWVPLSTNGPNTSTWALPAAVPGCGFENEPSCEPTGDFVLPVPASTVPSYYTITDSDTGTPAISNIITVANIGPGKKGEIQFYSDPNLSVDLSSYSALGNLCNEAPGSGCVGTFQLTTTAGTPLLNVQAASDEEAVFDPLGFGFDTSDDISFSFANCVQERVDSVLGCLIDDGSDYNPDFWNKDPTTQVNNNCYAYATDKATGTYPQPGRGAGGTPGLSDLSCATITARATADGLNPLGGATDSAACDSSCPNGGRKIALVVDPNVDCGFASSS